MLAIIGIVVVLGSILGGYIMEKGNPSILLQPAELVIIGGASIGALIVGSGKKIGLVMKSFGRVFSGGHVDKASFMQLLMLLNSIFSKAQREGLIALESHLDNPAKSDIFSKYPLLMNNPNIMAYITDNMRLIITASMSANDLDNLLEIDIETQKHEAQYAPGEMTRMADALPGMGIVAAVLGVTLAMGKIDAEPAELGHTVAAALVGTFLGILLSYGIVGPMAANLSHQNSEKSIYLVAIKMALIAFSEGSHPLLAVEAGRRAIPLEYRPTFMEVDAEIRKWKEKK